MTAVQEESAIRDNLGSIQQQTKEKEREIRQIELSIASISSEMVKVDFDTESFLSDGIETDTSLESIEPRSPSTSRDCHQDLGKQRADLFKEYAIATQECLELQQKYEQSKRKYTTLKIDQEKSPEERKLILAQKIEFTDIEISKKQQEIKQVEAVIAGHAASLAKNKRLYQENDMKKADIAERINAVIQSIVLKKVEKNNFSAQLAIKGADLCTLKQKRAEIQADLAEKKRAIGLSTGEVPIGSIISLLEEAGKRKMQGIHGVLFDLVTVQKQILIPFEALLFRKVFSIIVEDEKSASDLIRLNKEMRGAKIVVVPLTWVQPVAGDFNYPDESEHIAFEQFVEVKEEYAGKPRLQDLVTDICRGNILVEKLELATKFSKTFDCNCVTLEGQVVYKQGFLSRLGYSDPKTSKMSDYLEYSHTKHELRTAFEQEAVLQAEFEDLRSKEAAIAGELQGLIIQKESLIKEHETVWSDASGLMKACIQEQKLLTEYEEKQRSDSTVLSQLVGDRKSLEEALVSPKRGVSDEFRKELDAAFRSMYENKELFTRKTQLLTDLQAQLQSLEASSTKQQQANLGEQKREVERSFRRQVAEGISRSHSRTKDIIKDLTRRREVKYLQKQALLDDIGKLKVEESSIESQQEAKKNEIFKLKLDMQEKNQKKFDFQIGIDSFDTKIKSLNVDESEEHEALWALKKRDNIELITMLKKMMIAKLKYTQKDKANFEKLEEYFTTHRQYDSELRELNKSKKTFTGIIGICCLLQRLPIVSLTRPTRRCSGCSERHSRATSRGSFRTEELTSSWSAHSRSLRGRSTAERFASSTPSTRSSPSSLMTICGSCYRPAREASYRSALSSVCRSRSIRLSSALMRSMLNLTRSTAQPSNRCKLDSHSLQDISRNTQVFMTTFKTASFPDANANYFCVNCSPDQPATIQRVDQLEASGLLETGKRS